MSVVFSMLTRFGGLCHLKAIFSCVIAGVCGHNGASGTYHGMAYLRVRDLEKRGSL